jgi:hypothetical protein
MMTDTDMPTAVVGNFSTPLQLSLNMPKISHQDTIVAAIPRRIYSNGNDRELSSNC